MGPSSQRPRQPQVVIWVEAAKPWLCNSRSSACRMPEEPTAEQEGTPSGFCCVQTKRWNENGSMADALWRISPGGSSKLTIFSRAAQRGGDARHRAVRQHCSGWLGIRTDQTQRAQRRLYNVQFGIRPPCETDALDETNLRFLGCYLLQPQCCLSPTGFRAGESLPGHAGPAGVAD